MTTRIRSYKHSLHFIQLSSFLFLFLSLSLILFLFLSLFLSLYINQLTNSQTHKPKTAFIPPPTFPSFPSSFFSFLWVHLQLRSYITYITSLASSLIDWLFNLFDMCICAYVHMCRYVYKLSQSHISLYLSFLQLHLLGWQWHLILSLQLTASFFTQPYLSLAYLTLAE